MSPHRRAVVAFLVGAGSVTLAGCGDNNTAAGDSLTEVRETSYVTIEPATTTTTAHATPGASSDAVVPATSSSPAPSASSAHTRANASPCWSTASFAFGAGARGVRVPSGRTVRRQGVA